MESQELVGKSMKEYLESLQVESDMVNSPSHYRKGSIETIDYMEFLFGTKAVATYCLINSFKYRDRAPHKGKYEEDLQKCEWYVNKHNELIKKFGTKEEVIR